MPREKGFSLLELMVALAILAIVATTVFTRNGDTINQLYSLEQRTLGHWVMMNQLAKMRLEQTGAEDAPIRLGTRRDRVILGNRTWQVVAETKQTTHPWIRRIELSVFAVDNDDMIGPVDRITAFIGRH